MEPAGLREWLSWSVKSQHDEVLLELAPAGAEDTAFLIVAVFNDGTLYRPGWGVWLRLRAEHGDTRYDLLTLAWLEDSSDHAAIDPSLPLAQRGLTIPDGLRVSLPLLLPDARVFLAFLAATARMNFFVLMEDSAP